MDWAEARGELTALPDPPVEVRQQITAVHRQVLEAGGPVLRFDAPILADGGAQSDAPPVVVNLFGTTQRVAAGLGVGLDELDDLGAFLAALRAPTPPPDACAMRCRAGQC